VIHGQKERDFFQLSLKIDQHTKAAADRQAGGRQARQAANPQTDLLMIKELIGPTHGQTDRKLD